MLKMIDRYIQYRELKGDYANKIRGRLTKCAPYGEDYEGIRLYFQSIMTQTSEPKRKYRDSTIDKEIIREYQKFIKWKKENETMTEHENNQIAFEEEVEQTQPEIFTENKASQANDTTQNSNENTEATSLPHTNEDHETPVKKSAGRPKTTGRTEKFTLYMTAETMENLNIIASYDNGTVTDLLNNIVESYISTREDDINWVKDFEKMKEERKHKKNQLQKD